MRPLSRRDLLGLLGVAGLSAVAAACAKDQSSSGASPSPSAGANTTPSTTPQTTPQTTTPGTTTASSTTTAATTAPATTVSCVLTPEMTEGPYYIGSEPIRSDITEGKPGTPLRLVLTVVDATTCRPIPNAAVDIWHADALGNYSGFGSTTSNRSFLRGVQRTDSAGKATFVSIYPGWYPGRATHIHVKVYVGTSAVHTGQLFFDEAVNDAVYAKAPYNTRSGRRTTNSQDGIHRSGGAQSTVSLTPDGSGYNATMVMGVRSGAA